jgi:GYF domain 2
MKTEWFYRQAGREDGPLSSEAIRKMIATGKIDPGQAVWNREGDRLTFVRAAEVPQDRESFDGCRHAHSGG